MVKLIILVIFLLFFACKGAKETTSLPDKEVVSKEANEGNYRLVVSFFSPGNGIDHKMKREYVELIANYKAKISYEQTGWGREGEVDFCFSLKGLSKKEQEGFVKKSKELLYKSNRVHLYENAPCRHKR